MPTGSLISDPKAEKKVAASWAKAVRLRLLRHPAHTPASSSHATTRPTMANLKRSCHQAHRTPRTRVPQDRGPREQVLVRGVEISILRPGKLRTTVARVPHPCQRQGQEKNTQDL